MQPSTPRRLVDLEPELLESLAPAERDLVRKHLVVPEVAVPAGTGQLVHQPAVVAILVVDGLLVHDDLRREYGVLQLFGPGDVLDPRLLVAQPGAWRALTTARLVLLDARFAAVAQRCPSLLGWLTRRLFDGHHEQHELARIRMLPRVEQRVLEMLRHLAERWGRVTTQGISLALPLTHRELGRMVGARRPTVSLALKELRELDVVRRADDGFLLVAPPGTGGAAILTTAA